MGQGGGAQDSDGADCRGSGADWKEGSADAAAVAPGSCFPCGALNEVIASIKSGIDQLGEPCRRNCCECSPSPLSLSRCCHCHLLCLLFSFVAEDNACPFHLPLDGETSFCYISPDP